MRFEAVRRLTIPYLTGIRSSFRSYPPFLYKLYEHAREVVMRYPDMGDRPM